VVVTSVDGGLEDGGSCDCLYHGTRMQCGSAAGHDGVEPVVIVGCVRHSTHSAVGLHQAVLSLHHVTVTFFPLALDVPGMRVIDAIVETVLGVRLEYVAIVLLYT
jgi:hypothetical protein